MLISKTSVRITLFHVCSFTEEHRLKFLTKCHLVILSECLTISSTCKKDAYIANLISSTISKLSISHLLVSVRL